MGGIATVGVVGLGTMGAGIVEVLARTGLAVVAVDINDAAVDRGRSILEASVSRAEQKGRLDSADAQALRDRIAWSSVTADLARCDLVVEAVPERFDLKSALLGQLDEVCPPHTILATNTSSLPVTRLAASTSRPDRVVGMHFFNPAPVMALVEVVTTVLTSADAAEGVRALADRCGKTPVLVGDRAGFIANTLLIGYLNEAVRLFADTSVSRDDLDAAMRLGAGLPMGPLALCDLIGLDVVLEIVDVLFAESRDPMHAAPPLLRGMVAGGLLGRKTGRGFYSYERPGSGRVTDAAEPVAPAPVTGGPVTLVASTAHADELAAALAHLGFDVTRTTAADLEPAASGAILVEVSPLVPLRDVAARIGARRADAVGVHPLHRGPNGLAVEIARGPFTGVAALDAARALASALDATPVVCDDLAGLVVGRLLTLYLNDAARMAGSGYADPEAIDAAMRLGCGYPVGPMQFLDRFGAGSVVATLDRVHAETGLARHAPVPLLRDAAAYGVEPSSLVGPTTAG